MPLWPFASSQQVVEWQEAYRSDGQQPWHLDAGLTSLGFASWLGYTETNTVVAESTVGPDSHVSVGFHTGESATGLTTTAIVHLVRWGNGTDAPWEVVGTLDTTLTLTSPSYGATVSSPVKAGGMISGVDESIRVQIRTLSGLAASSCCLPAGGMGTPWSTTVSFTAPSGSVVTIAAQTGAHIAAVERFAVTGVRVR